MAPPAACALGAASSAVARGTAYEHACMSFLQTRLFMDMYRTGGASDRGIDLAGWWAPHAIGRANGSTIPRMRVLTQCKAESRAVGPAVVRELEGSLVRAAWQGDSLPHAAEPSSALASPLLGILASHAGFTKQAMMYMRSSKLPLLFLHLTTPQATTSFTADADVALDCRGFLWNDALASRNGPLLGKFEPAWISPRTHKNALPQLTLLRDGVRII